LWGKWDGDRAVRKPGPRQPEFAAGWRGKQCNATWRATPTAAPAERITAGHSNAKTTGLDDRPDDDVSLDGVERIGT